MQLYLFHEAIAHVPGLDENRLDRLIRAEIVRPLNDGTQAVLREADIARLHLCCDLGDTFELDDDALAMVMDLIDELHGLRGDLRAVMAALDGEAEEVRARLRKRIAAGRRRSGAPV